MLGCPFLLMSYNFSDIEIAIWKMGLCMKNHSLIERAWLRRGVSACMSGVLAATLMGTAPLAAYASDEDVASSWAAATSAALTDPDYQPYSFASSDAVLAVIGEDSSEWLSTVTKFDLRDPDGDGDRKDSVVTPVKSQIPWGTCWTFGSIAACETSILSELGTTAADTPIDLSELQIVNSVYLNGGAPESVVGPDQAGEGFHSDSADANIGFMAGGFFGYASSIFASGIGPIDESYSPYKNAEGIKKCSVIDAGGSIARTLYLTDSQIAEYKSTHEGATVEELSYAGNYIDENGDWVRPDWSTDSSLWNASKYNLEDGNIMPDPKVLNEDGSYKCPSEEAKAAIKSEMYEHGRAVGMCFYADTSLPDQDGNAKYLDQKTWAHYTYKNEVSNHIVTIVGWDDDYPAENFGNTAGIKPEGNGAWLVKNSWGSETEDFPNGPGKHWGIVENGEHTGYFWLSYYDQSIEELETFNFDISSYGDNTEYYINQYDYLPGRLPIYNSFDEPTSSANIFTAEGDMSLRTVGCATFVPNTTVTYQIYLLDSEAASPTDPEHSTLVRTLDATYSYGGYHRTTLDESNWLAMREGQRYAVVTTQYCDGKWYQGVAYVEQGVGAEDSTYLLDYYRGYMKSLFSSYYYDRFYDEHIAKGDSVADAEVAAKAEAETTLQSEEAAARIEKEAQAAYDDMNNSYFEVKMNTGESWTGTTQGSASEANSETLWSDWSVVAQAAIEKAKDEGKKVAVDNVSIKAFSEIRSFASVEELDSLAATIAEVKASLATMKISADGSDVEPSDMWLSQAQYDAISATIASAEKLLALAGADYATTLANTTPSSQEVSEAIASLPFSAQGGTKATSGNQGSSKAAKDGGSYAKTSDNALSAAGAIALVSVIAAVITIVARRHHRD